MEQPIFQPVYEPFDIQNFIDENKRNLANEEQPDIKQMLINTANNKQGNGFILTYNNFTHTPDEFMELLKQLPHISRINFQIERGQSGTVHYQCYTHHIKQIYWGQVRRKFIKLGLHRVRVENRIASPQHADGYCSKAFQEVDPKKDTPARWYEIQTDDDGVQWFQTKVTPENYQFGVLDNNQGKRTDLDNFVQSVLDGATDEELITQNPKLYMLHKSKINGLRQGQRTKFLTIKRDMQVSFLCGETGTGKTTAVIDKYPAKDLYKALRGKDPFFNYDGQDIVFFDEFKPSRYEIEDLNEWLDRSPLNINIRYGSVLACFTKVIFASNTQFKNVYKHLRDSLDEDDRRKYQALMRKIHNVYNFDSIEDFDKFMNDEPSPNPYAQKSKWVDGVRFDKRQVCEQSGMVILTEEEQKDLPF